MCNVLCEPEEKIHVIVVGSWIPDIEYLRVTDLGMIYTYEELVPNYEAHGLIHGARIEILAIEHAIEGEIPESQAEQGYVYPYLITFQLLDPKELAVAP